MLGGSQRQCLPSSNVVKTSENVLKIHAKHSEHECEVNTTGKDEDVVAAFVTPISVWRESHQKASNNEENDLNEENTDYTNFWQFYDWYFGRGGREVWIFSNQTNPMR